MFRKERVEFMDEMNEISRDMYLYKDESGRWIWHSSDGEDRVVKSTPEFDNILDRWLHNQVNHASIKKENWTEEMNYG